MELTLQDVANYLDNVGIQFLATIGLDGKPKVPPHAIHGARRQQVVVLHELQEGCVC